MRAPAVSPVAATRVFRVALGALILIVLTGAGVRLTQSGLGCPDWPACSGSRLVAAWHYHAVIEFGNRVVTVAVTLAVLAALAAAWLRVPRRRDLVGLAAGLVAGVVAQAVLGGITVLAKLAPGWVMAHFLLSMAVIAVAVVLVRRSGQPEGERRTRVAPEVVWGGRALVALTAVVLGLGTVVTGSGPHSGAVGVGRLPISARDAAEVHSGLVLMLVGFALAAALLLRSPRVPPDVERNGRVLVYVLGVQGAIGYAQYFSGVPAALVELHVAGALAVWLGVLRLHLSLTARKAVQVVDVPTEAVPVGDGRALAGV
ncbi:MAG TPA: COX15/CtaA family protein [Acidimicrobiales bacterium]|nr:COX15/CtaA family protein [Acidimicrobiales bacterium]